MKQILTKFDDKMKPLVCLISKDLSKDLSSDNTVTYLTSNVDNLTMIPSELKSRPLLAPKILNDLVESSVFEYCVVFKINCISIILPEMHSIIDSNKEFIPKPIVDCIKQLNQFSDSNIYIWITIVFMFQ